MVVELTEEERKAMLKLERRIDDVYLHDDIAAMYQKGQPVSLRDGWHSSDGRKCDRMNVLANRYVQNVVVHSQHTGALFEHGTEGHERWQRAMENGGFSLAIEKKHIETFWRLNFTPDQILLYRGLPHVTEYKMWQEKAYEKYVVDLYSNKPKKPPKEVVVQLMRYMWFLGEKYHQGLIVIENKNTQRFVVWRLLYDYELIKDEEKYYNQMYLYDKVHGMTGKLPKRLDACTSPDDPTPSSCGCCKACFSTPEERIALRRPQAWE